jgi:hypothetical protein
MKKLIALIAFIYSFTVVFCQSENFYDIENIQTIEIYFEYDNWDFMLDTAKIGSGGYIMANEVIINGTAFDSVGVKYKGNSSYNQNQDKNPFHIELDTYKSQNYQDYKDIKLSNGFKDPSFVREVIAYNTVRKYMNASLSNYANLYINDDYIGLYCNTESITKTFVEDRFGSKSNAFFKCNPVYGSGPENKPNLKYKGADSTLYYNSYEIKSDYGWQDLINLCYAVENNIEEIESFININEVLWMHAFNNLMVNLDSYSGGITQNYYLYMDDNEIFRPIVWDLNECFGGFKNTGVGPPLNTTEQMQEMDHLLHLTSNNWPLISKVLNVPLYRRMYLAHYKTLLEENIIDNSYYSLGEYLQNIIDDDVFNDPNKLYPYDFFNINIDNDVSIGPMGTIPGIQKLMNGRKEYLLSLDDFNYTEPIISNIEISENEPEINSSVFVTANIENAGSETVFLYYRNSGLHPFNVIQMYDDGEHGDNESGDGIFGVEIHLTSYTTDFYMYAENENIGRFSPRRAEMEYHTITADFGNVESGMLIVNEFMASNSATAMDEFGEYDDWIEIYNPSDESISLNDMYLSDNYDNPYKWEFPFDTLIMPDSFIIIWADGETYQGGLHTNFKLSASGEEIILTHASGIVIDSISFGQQLTDISMQRCVDNENEFFFAAPTFNEFNTCISVNDENFISINEFLASNSQTQADESGEFDDWIELYNNSLNTIDLSDIYVSDSYINPYKWKLPESAEINPDSYLIIWADGQTEQGELHANFRLSASGEEIIITHANGYVIDFFSFDNQTTDISMQRCPDGVGEFIFAEPSFNATNNCSHEIEELNCSKFKEFDVFPNPVTDILNIKSQSVKIEEISIFDFSGRKIDDFSIENPTSSFIHNIADYEYGVYLIRVNYVYTLKFIKTP